MQERRGFLMALSTTLIGVGFGAFLAYYIAMAALPIHRRGAYGWVPVVCLIGVGLGVVSGAAWEVSWRRNKRRIRDLGKLAREGFEIRLQLWGAKDMDHLATAAMAGNEWHVRMVTWAHMNVPQYRDHLFNTGGQFFTGDPHESGMETRPECIAAVDVMLQRIGDLMLKL